MGSRYRCFWMDICTEEHKFDLLKCFENIDTYFFHRVTQLRDFNRHQEDALSNCYLRLWIAPLKMSLTCKLHVCVRLRSRCTKIYAARGSESTVLFFPRNVTKFKVNHAKLQKFSPELIFGIVNVTLFYYLGSS